MLIEGMLIEGFDCRPNLCIIGVDVRRIDISKYLSKY